MTGTRIREALLDVRDAVDVPAPDEVGLHARVQAERRRRTTLRVVAAACLVLLASSGTWLVRPAGDGPGGPDDQPLTTPPAAATATSMFPIVLAGRLETVLPDGSGYGTRIRAEEVLGLGPAGIVVIGRDSHLLLVPLMPSGQPGTPRDLGDGRAVRRAWLDKSGETLAFVDLDGRVHVRAVGSSTDLEPAVTLPPSAMLVAVDGTRWASVVGGTVTLHAPSGNRDLAPGGAVTGVELAGDSVAVEGPDGVQFFDTASGRRLATVDGLGTGSLSPDGRWYLGAPGEQQLDRGARPDWSLVDARTGDRAVYAGRPARARATVVTWQDADRFLVVVSDPRQPGNRIVEDCSTTTRRCAERYNDPGNTLAVASR